MLTLIFMGIAAAVVSGCGADTEKSKVEQYAPRGDCTTDYGMNPPVAVCRGNSGNRDAGGVGTEYTTNYNLSQYCAEHSAGGQCSQVKPATCTLEYGRYRCTA